MGFAGIWSVEAAQTPYLPLGVAAVDTERIELGTAIAVAFPRSPMVHAMTAWDLQKASKGRMILGLGTHPQAQRAPLLRRLRPPRPQAQGHDPRHPPHLGGVRGRAQARLPRRVLHARLHPALLQPRPHGLRQAEDLRRRRGGVDVPDGGGGLRRHPHPPHAQREVHRGGREAQRRGGSPAGGAGPLRLRVLHHGLRRHRRGRPAPDDGRPRPPPDRLLRLHAGVPQRARPPRLGRPAAPPRPARPGGEDGRGGPGGLVGARGPGALFIGGGGAP